MDRESKNDQRWLLYRLMPWLPCHHFWLRLRPKTEGWKCERCGALRPVSFSPKPHRAWSGG